MDIILGGAGADYLSGGDGNDGLNGEAGTDWLTGGRGTDTFFFTNASDANGDLIADFRREDGDHIDFSYIDARPSIAGDQAFTWIGTAPFTAEGQLRYRHFQAGTFIEGNTGGDLSPDFTISVVGLVPFIASDFTL